MGGGNFVAARRTRGAGQTRLTLARLRPIGDSDPGAVVRQRSSGNLFGTVPCNLHELQSSLCIEIHETSSVFTNHNLKNLFGIVARQRTADGFGDTHRRNFLIPTGNAMMM